MRGANDSARGKKGYKENRIYEGHKDLSLIIFVKAVPFEAATRKKQTPRKLG